METKWILIGLICLISCFVKSPASAQDVIDYPIEILDVVGKNSDQVMTLLGPANRCDPIDNNIRCDYRRFTIEVTYINQQADVWHLEGFDQIPMQPNALSVIGLRTAPPFKRDAFSMHWMDHQGLAVISLFGNAQYLSSIRIRRR